MSQRTVPLSEFDQFYTSNLITDVLNIVKSGKEATVHRCKAHPATGKEFLAAKVYRPMQQRSFKNDAIYQGGRSLSGRDRRALKKKSRRGRAIQFNNWIECEYETLNLLHRAGADVPMPFAHSGSAILMEYIGDRQLPAPMLNRISPRPDEAQQLFDRLMLNVQLMLRENRVHADLSPFNILYWQGSLKIIDFPQAVHPRHNPSAFSLLQRDIDNLCRYFSRYGVQVNAFELAKEFWMQFLSRGSETDDKLVALSS